MAHVDILVRCVAFQHQDISGMLLLITRWVVLYITVLTQRVREKTENDINCMFVALTFIVSHTLIHMTIIQILKEIQHYKLH